MVIQKIKEEESNNTKEVNKHPRRLYDAILIDEGQDFCSEWYDLLRKYLKEDENSELVLFVDLRQNIYNRENWTEKEMKGTGFRGRWRILGDSFRIKAHLSDELNRFVKLYFSQTNEDEPISSQRQLKLDLDSKKGDLIWENVNSSNQIQNACIQAYNYLVKLGDHPSDIVILSMCGPELTLDLIKYFEERNIDVSHVFSNDEKKRMTLKTTFWMKQGKLKICTVHSFKGWESKSVILLIPEGHCSIQQDNVVYTGMSRAQENLIVINASDRYRRFAGEVWHPLLKKCAF